MYPSHICLTRHTAFMLHLFSEALCCEWMDGFRSFFSPPPDFSYFTSHCAGSDLMDCYEINEEHMKHNVSLVIHTIWRTGRQICTWGSICLMVLSKWVWHRSLFQSPEKVINVPLRMLFFYRVFYKLVISRDHQQKLHLYRIVHI